MGWGAAFGAVASIAGGLLGSKGSSDAADAQKQAAREQIAYQKWLFEQQTALQAPFREAGLSGQDRYLTLLGLKSPTSNNALDPDFGKYAGEFTADKFQADPGYAFRLSEGMKALDRQAAARGGLISGNALKAAGEYGQQSASDEYTNAYNRYYNDRNQLLNPLGNLAGMAQNATNQVQQAGSQMGQNVNNAYGDLGNARASSYASQAQAWGNALNQLGNIGMDYYAMKNRGYGIPGTTQDNGSRW